MAANTINVRFMVVIPRTPLMGGSWSISDFVDEPCLNENGPQSEVCVMNRCSANMKKAPQASRLRGPSLIWRQV
ncbi:MAG: hypothetical protein EBR82_01780 [Caulobacteraceae bacterium]|nr:hypothetical protein [Caulobacteraceae bacterium]